MLRNRWTRPETRGMAKSVLYAIAEVDADALEVGAIRPRGEASGPAGFVFV